MGKKNENVMFKAEVIAAGRVTIPKEIREAWAIVEGDTVILLFVSNQGSHLPTKVEAPKQ